MDGFLVRREVGIDDEPSVALVVTGHILGCACAWNRSSLITRKYALKTVMPNPDGFLRITSTQK